MKMLRSLLVLALVLFSGPVLAQVTPGTSPLTIAKGGTGGATASAARSSLGVPTGASGAVLGFLNTANTWSAQQSFSTVAIGGASIGSNALAVTGTSAFGGNTTLTTGGTSAITVASTTGTGDAYFVSQNSSHSWIVGTNGDGVCGAVTGAHIFLFYDATNTACRGLITAAGGWIIGSATADPGNGNLNLSGGALQNNGTNPTGTGAYVRATSPTLVTPALGTPSSATLTNATGLPLAGISNFGTGVATAAAANLSANGGLTSTIASGSTAMGTGAISSATCASAVTATATNTATTDVVTASFNGDPSAVTGYIPSTAGMLTILVYPTTNNVNFKVCNNTGVSITPAAVTINWRVVR